jgi:hypothetical protein
MASARMTAPQVLRTPPDPDEWSANDVLTHLRACSDRWGEAATRIVEEDDPQLRATNPRIWISAPGRWSVPGSRSA